ncbi:MAG: hypothetical protein ACI92G_002099 [Candidatus Pelagisphaera sp.]|jgi:hypothetical protein
MRTRLFPKRNSALRAGLLVLVGLVLGLLPSLVADDYERLDSATKRWIEIEAKIAHERNAWKAQKKILEQSVLVLEADVGGLTSNLERLQLEVDFRAGELSKNTESFDDQEVARIFYSGKLEALEERFDRVRASTPFFLEDELSRAREKLDAGDKAALGERAQILIAAFTTIEDFNRTVTIDYVARKLKDGREVMVSVLYWGLSRAYAVDPQGTVAWELKPGEPGWSWTEKPEYLAEILELIKVYEQKRPPSIQLVPGKVMNQVGGEG